MRRNVKNDKVLRAIAIGLSTMIAATSMPVTISADSQPLPISVETDAIDNVVDEIEKHDDPQTEKVDESGAADLITKANTEAGNSTPTNNTTANDTLKEKIGQAASAMDDGQDNDSDVKEDLGDAKTAMQGALQADQDAKDIIQYSLVFEVDENGELVLDENGAPVPVYETEKDENGNTKTDEDGNPVYKLNEKGEKIQKTVEVPIVVDVPLFELDENGEQKLDDNGNPIPIYESNEDGTIKMVDGKPVQKTVPMLKLYSELKKDTEDAADNALNNASVAMDNNSTKEQAEQAKADAEDDLEEAEGDLEAAKAELQNVEDKVEDAKTTLAAAQKKKAEADQKVADATAALNRILSQSVDKDGKPIVDSEGNPVYEGDIEAAEQALKDAVAEAKRLEGEAEAAYNAYKNENLNNIVTQYNVLTGIVKNDPDWNNNPEYWPAANKLCNLILQYYVFANEKGVRVGQDNFEVELIDSWTAGDPYPVYNVDGDKTSGIKEWRVDYTSNKRTFTEVIGKGYIHDPDNGYKYDENGNLISNPNEQNVAEGWIHSGTAANRNLDNRVVVTYYAKKLDENGNPVLDDEGNEVYEKKTKYFNYGTYGKGEENEGQIYIYERTYDIKDGKIVEYKKTYGQDTPETPYIAPTPESWDNGTGENAVKIQVGTDGKLILGDTQHSVSREEGGYYVIDTTSSEVKETKTTEVKNVTTPNGNVTTTIAYAAAKDENGNDIITKTYEKTTYTVVDSYNKKTVEENKNAENTSALKELVDSYKDKKVAVKVYALGVNLDWIGIDLSYTVDPNNLNWFDRFSAWAWGSGFNVKVSWLEDDTSSPKDTHEEAGIYEITSKDFVETTTTTTKQPKITSGRYNTYKTGSLLNGTLEIHWAEDNAREALRLKKEELRNQGYIVNDDECDVYVDVSSVAYRYYVNYYSQSQSTKTVTKEISRTKYAADTYAHHTEYNGGQAYVAGSPAQNEYKAQKVVWQTDDDAIAAAQDTHGPGLYTAARAFTDDTFGNYITHLNDLQTQWNNYTTAKQAAQVALNKVTELKNKILALKNVQTTCGAAVSALEVELNKAEMALEIAQGNVETLEAKVAAAQEAVNGIDLSRFNPSTIQGGISQRKFDADDDGDDSSSTTTTPGTGTFVTYTTPDNEFTLIPVGYAGAGAGAGAGAQAGGRMVASNRAADRSGVLGVRADEETDTKKSTVKVINNIDNSEDKNKDKKNNAGEQKLVKVENNLVPLADTPFEEGAGMNWAWLLAAAAAAGAGAYGYGKHKKAVAANEEMKKYKK